MRAGEVPVQWLVGRRAGARAGEIHTHSECGLWSASATFTGWACRVRSLPPSRLEMERRPTGGLLHFISSCC